MTELKQALIYCALIIFITVNFVFELKLIVLMHEENMAAKGFIQVTNFVPSSSHWEKKK